MTDEERNLLNKMQKGKLDGLVGNYSEMNGVGAWKEIKNGEPIAYRQGKGSKYFDGEENVRIPGKITETHYDTDAKKLGFLQQYGFLMKDKDAKAYSAKFKPY